jgi:pimeloyl-ACP methyl ester carboxylesterase
MHPGPASGETARLRDGRRLGYSEWGDPGGRPVLSFHGNPGSRLSVWGGVGPLRAGGVRLITVDRPGIGLSDPKPTRAVADWAADIAELADHLDLERFAVVGYSVGGAYAAACAHALPDRVTTAALVSSIVPLDRPGRMEELGKRLDWRLARSAPWALRTLYALLALVARATPTIARAVFTARMSPPDRGIARRPEVAEREAASSLESARQGVGELVKDLRVAVRPWGFDPREIRVPLLAWQGDRDSSIPASWGEWWARTVPNSRLTLCTGEGHLLIEDRIGEILGATVAEGVVTR